MTEHILVKLLEHNHWANLQIIRSCLDLTNEQLDSKPHTAAYGSIRATLLHLVSAQVGYLRMLTVPVDQRRLHPFTLEFDQLEMSAAHSGERLISLAEEWTHALPTTRLETTDGYFMEAWALIVQIINHASEHREQIKGMLTSLGITPPEIDGWVFAETTGALVPI